jgi:hypothetical protein
LKPTEVDLKPDNGASKSSARVIWSSVAASKVKAV